MALIDLGTADGSQIGNPESGSFFLFFDSNNSNLLTRRDSSGTDTLFGTGGGLDELGWIAIGDTTYTSLSPFSISSGVDTVLQFNIDTVQNGYAPNGYTQTDFFDDTNYRIDSPVLGASYAFRLTFKAVPTNSSRVLNVTYSIGTGVGSQIPVYASSHELRSAGVASNISETSLIYTLNTFLTNGMEIILNATTDTDIYDISMVISRLN